ncbi:Xylose transport system permease protein XylH [bioreactor metagenome]|jgi:putative multiple sugar transport system permease protein|uniref:Xylose transport system permease protein XylH n=1 Tax=bioreactor metagenome TaxID=1076179 RepID=A0A645CJN3_9ZZZZ
MSSKQNALWEKTKQFLLKNTMIIALVLVYIFFVIQSQGRMFLPQNINNLIMQNSYVVILAVGMLLCILTGGNIDLSVGATVCLVGAIAGVLMVNLGWNIYLSMVLCLLVGVAIGVWQGFWIAYVRIPPFIVTLAGMLLFRGLAQAILGGLTISGFSDAYLAIFNNYVFIPALDSGDMKISSIIFGAVCCVVYVVLTIFGNINKKKKGYAVENRASLYTRLVIICGVVMLLMYKLSLYKGIPYILLWLIGIVAIYTYITAKTTFGRHFYALGGNEKATKLSGINTNRIYFSAYVNVSFLSALAALVVAARFTSANPAAGTNYELDAIGSCFIGGASAYGGIGKVSGAVIGAVLMGVLNLGMNIIGVDSNFQKVVKGLVLLAAVIFDVVSKRKAIKVAA